MSADLNKKPKLAIGQVWKNGYGDEVEIISCSPPGGKYPWNGSNGLSYTDVGSFVIGVTQSKHDLVALVKDVQVQTEGNCSHQGLQAALNKHKAICLHFKSTDEFLEFEYSSAKELDDCIIFYGTDCTPGWGSTSVFYKSEIVCMHFAEKETNV